MTHRRQRIRVLLTREDEPRFARIVVTDVEKDLLDALAVYDPGLVGFALDIDRAFRDDLPEDWDVDRFAGVDSLGQGDIAGTRDCDDALSTLPYGVAQVLGA